MFEEAQDSRERIQRALFVHESDLGGVANHHSFVAATVVLGEHVDLRDRLASTFRHVVEVEQRAELVDKVSRVHKADVGQLLDHPALLDVTPLGELLAPQREVGLNLWTAVGEARVFGRQLLGLVAESGSDVTRHHALVRVHQQTIGELALAIGEAELIRALFLAAALYTFCVRQAGVRVRHSSAILKIVLCSTLCGTLC